MTKNDWQDAGDQFRRMIQEAVDSKDFSKLGSTLTNVVNDTVDGLQSALQENLSKAQGAASRGFQGTQDTVRNRYQRTNSEAAERIRRNIQEKHAAGQAAARKEKKLPARVKAPGEISGNVVKWTGYSLSGMFGLSAAVLGVIGVTTGIWVGVPMGILMVLFGSSMVIGARGSHKVELARRFRRYMSVLGDRTYCLVEELAAAVGQNSKFVKKDLKKMIRRGYFKEGYLDSKETLLITDRTTYQQYLTSQTEYEFRRAQNGCRPENQTESQTESQDAREPELTPECREILQEGQKYIRHIRECNEKIPGEEISGKLDRLELVVTRIFREIEKNPDAAGDLKKLMSYYLPTTRKLLDAYCEMDAQPVAGQNIESTKREIESALDTINTAFENLLDSLFQDEAWDISSDITVLNTMLAQEGLTGKDFV